MAFKIGIALGGGGVRGLANIGVMKALEEDGVFPEAIAGTSMGAIVGAVYADTGRAINTERVITSYLYSDEFQEQVEKLVPMPDIEKGMMDRFFGAARKGYLFYRFIRKESVIDEGQFLDIEKIIPDKNFNELKIPFACVAIDLVSGNKVIINSGLIRPAVRGSSAVPGMLPPVELNGMMLVDGGWIESVPVSAARLLDADFIIACDVTRDITPINYEEEMKSSMDILSRTNDITKINLNHTVAGKADFVIRPDVGNVSWSEFRNIETYIKAGYDAAKDRTPELKRVLQKESIIRKLKLKGLIDIAGRLADKS